MRAFQWRLVGCEHVLGGGWGEESLFGSSQGEVVGR